MKMCTSTLLASPHAETQSMGSAPSLLSRPLLCCSDLPVAAGCVPCRAPGRIYFHRLMLGWMAWRIVAFEKHAGRDVFGGTPNTAGGTPALPGIANVSCRNSAKWVSKGAGDVNSRKSLVSSMGLRKSLISTIVSDSSTGFEHFSRILAIRKLRRTTALRRLHKIRQPSTVGREGAGGIGHSGVAGQQGRLAATSAKIPFAKFTFPARQWHPFLPAKTVECRRFMPNPAQPMIADVVKSKFLDLLGRRAGQHFSRRIDGQKLPAPPVHARLGSVAVIIGRDKQNVHPAEQPLLGPRGYRDGGGNLFASGQQSRAIAKGPAVELNIGQFEAFGLQFFGHSDDLLQAINVVTVQHDIDRQRKTSRARHPGSIMLDAVHRGAGDAVCPRPLVGLKTDLDVVQPRRLELAEARFVQAGGAGDQIGVKA